MIEVSLLTLTIILTPIAIYLCAKAATYGILMGKYRFRQNHPEERESNHGQSS